MTRDDYIKQCLMDALSALDIKYPMPSTQPIEVAGDYIYPQIAIKRIKSVINVDKLFPKK